jgi:hypothetical protein
VRQPLAARRFSSDRRWPCRSRSLDIPDRQEPQKPFAATMLRTRADSNVGASPADATMRRSRQNPTIHISAKAAVFCKEQTATP